MEPVFFPLDEELELLPGELSATLAEGVARLGTKMPFEHASAELAFFWGVELDETTVRRHTQAAGAAYVAEQAADVERLERERPAAPAGPTVQYLSADGAMVPLVGGQWAEVKTLAIGEVEVRPGADGLPEAHTTNLTYFSRLADAETFTRQAYVEAYQRGTESAGVVCAVQDGAEWLQGLVDVLRPDAVRILDFPHAVEHLTAAAQPSLGIGTPTLRAWLDEQAHTLKHAANGARQVVVEARLKGSGMHWARVHVDPLVALRTVICANRWGETWPRIASRLRTDANQRRRARWHTRHPLPTESPATVPPQSPPILAPVAAEQTAAPRGKSVINGRPTALHPWKRQLCLAGRRRGHSSAS